MYAGLIVIILLVIWLWNSRELAGRDLAGRDLAGRDSTSHFESPCVSPGLTTGSMPAIEIPQYMPWPGGCGGVACQGRYNCCGGFNVPPNV